MGGALCRPPGGARTSANTGNHGVSDPAWRPAFRPTRVRRGRSRHGCRCRCRCRCGCRTVTERAAACYRRCRRQTRAGCPDNPCVLLRKHLASRVHTSQPGGRPPAITHSSFVLCSARSRRVASLRPHEMCAAAALTAPARRSCPGSCVMADDERVPAVNGTHLNTFRPGGKVEALHAVICRSHIRSPRSTCTA